MGIISRLHAPKAKQTRTYAAAKLNRLTADWVAPTNSADMELVSSLTSLRARSRQLCRDNAYAKRARLIVINNVVGSGIYMEPQVKNRSGKLIEAVNDDIECAWDEWTRAENCHTGGTLNFGDFERQAMGQMFEAGEILVRKHYQPFGSQGVPFSLELIEAERLADEFTKPPVQGDVGLYRMGIERNEFGRPLAFWLRRYHPGEVRFPQGVEPNIFFRVPAQEMFHLYVCDRWPQTRGVPWLHAVARRLNDMDGYAEAEIVAARGAAAYMGIISTPDEAWNDQDNPDDQPQFDLEPGAVQKLNPGEKFDLVDPSRPNPNMDPFMRLMLREVAAGAGPSYESLSRDYSQSNYSSSRLALLDDRDLWKTLQQFFIRTFREPLHREWLRQSVLSGKLPSISKTDYLLAPAKFSAVSFKPRGWQWIDPVKEVEAYIKARRAGFMSTGQIIALTGGGVDLGDTWEEIEAENQSAQDMGLVFVTDPALINDKGAAQSVPGGTAPEWDASGPGGEGDPAATEQPDPSARVIKLRDSA